MQQTNKALITLIIFLGGTILGLGIWYLFESSPTSDQDKRSDKPIQTDSLSFAEGPTLTDTPLTNAPSYLFLFTHTEDPFNHELSEERYWRIGEMVRDVSATYPEVDLTWTIEFMGSDAKTITDRTEETGLVNYLLELKDDGLVEFGYHAHHDPTYANRPQNDLSPTPTYQEAYDAFWTWVTCEKDVLRGGCVEERGGGLEAVYNTFGQVEIVTGLGIGQGVQFERSAGSQVVRTLLPERFVGFGFPDHGATTRDRTYTTTRDALLELLTPTHETSSATIWMDNVLRINDSASLEDINPDPLDDGSENYERELAKLDGTRSIVINTGVASKYLYTEEGTSPTIWGYSNPNSPELPNEFLLSSKEREKAYQLTEEGLTYLAERISEDPEALQFVSTNEVLNLFTSDDYWNVTEDELAQMSLWILNNWDGEPPAWVYDGEDFYSLVDAFALLAQGLNGAFEPTGVVSEIYGPWSLSEPSTTSVSVSARDLSTLASDDLFTNNRMQERYMVGDQTLTATQILYAWSYLFTANQMNVEVETISIPSTNSAPETYDLLENLGCTDCLDTTWSLKPARFQD
ncbi:hypothetical protein CO174_03775 [Candidatus Uhrbacteria bacterium CG_4_9_14_3_um_filter_50_9]|uniref:Uncharacterized protein n=1 Tax=Candidatus Uhrbacteria bacterium CG_4_9_14_3_um_filter_50_9 TaxID=1975035 RepID=A0A2M7XCA6_9BACT|nr:MAG: hypothetical protein CO174_03775 [Candidatus Uhrbacteria bacterium CG_4_9_14_3_um_filter_50_9]